MSEEQQVQESWDYEERTPVKAENVVPVEEMVAHQIVNSLNRVHRRILA